MTDKSVKFVARESKHCQPAISGPTIKDILKLIVATKWTAQRIFFFRFKIRQKCLLLSALCISIKNKITQHEDLARQMGTGK